MQRHPADEVKKEVRILGHCVALAVGVEGGLSDYLKVPCSQLLKSIGSQNYLSVSTMTRDLCLSHAKQPFPFPGVVRLEGGVEQLAETASEEELIQGLRSTDLNRRLAFVIAALESQRGLEGVDWDILKASGSRSYHRFLALLGTRLGYHWPGYCAANSVGMFPLCSGILVCRAGEDFWQVAQNNLSPIQFEQLRAARVAGGP